jgi:hypothetical protein
MRCDLKKNGDAHANAAVHILDGHRHSCLYRAPTLANHENLRRLNRRILAHVVSVEN